MGAAVDAAGEVPEEPAIGGAEHGVTVLGVGADPVDMLEDPLDLAAGEIGRRQKPGLVPDDLAPAVAVQGGRQLIGPGVLPHDGVVVRTPRPPVPDHGRLPLVGYPEGHEVRRQEPPRVHGRLDRRRRPLPDLDGVVLDPARPGHDLTVLELMTGHLAAVVVEDHATGAGRALVDGGDELSHQFLQMEALTKIRRNP
jgi:hypothetical protein